MAKRKRSRRAQGKSSLIWQLVGVGTLAVVTAVLVSVALQPAQAPASAQTPRSVSSAPQETAEPPAETARVAMLGDSYSPPMGQAIPDYHFASILAPRLSWEVLSFGLGGTGYTNPGQANEGDDVYLARVPAIIAASPTMVIVQGSVNDGDYETTRDAALEVFAALQAGLPGVPIIAIGPSLTPSLGDSVTVARDAVRDAASESGVRFIDPIEDEWLVGNPDWFVDDGVHPSGTGQTELARRLQEALAVTG